VILVESSYKIEPFYYDKHISNFRYGFKQFDMCWPCFSQFPMLSGRHHCVLSSPVGSDGRMYVLFRVPLPPTIIITHYLVIIIVQGAKLHDP
jgi:hypothetical protein